MRKTSRTIIALALPLIVLFGKPSLEAIVHFIETARPCHLYSQTGIYCPACGVTRSTAALLRLDVLASLRYNVLVAFLCLVALALYIEFVLKLFDKNIRVVPRGNVFIFTVLTLFMTYFVVRNFIAFLTPAV